MFVSLKVYNALPCEEAGLKLDFEREFGERVIEVNFPKLSDEDIRRRAGLSAEIQCSVVKDRLCGEDVTEEETSREVDMIASILKRHLHKRLVLGVNVDEEDKDDIAASI